ncbi:MAG: bifunctional protein-serine/threonine kinase/phosphatase [Rhizobiales bacterium]|nr:protein kinase [Hyphomicrobiales bacterium]NRB15867.1 bifunctional protein-serine/threonine kinase/phosphatase [Hyphomicrobiales bacterium]
MTEQISIGAYSNAGLKPCNEDSYGIMLPEPVQSFTKGIAIAIADGMSTCPKAKEASETCVKCFLQDYFSTPNSWGVKKSVGKILNATNSWMFSQTQNGQAAEFGMVSTLSAMVIKAGKAHIFHVGDSRISLVRDGKIEPLTQDHILKDFTGHSFLNRAMGTGIHLDMDYKTVPLRQDDVLIFTTDGVHEYVSPTNIKQLALANIDNLPGAAKQIVGRALSAGSPDDVTCQIVKIDDLTTISNPDNMPGGANLPFPPLLENGQILDGYKIIREIHTNSRSQVYLAQPQGQDNYVAIKTPSVNFDDDQTYINAFKREAWIGAQINLPNLVKYHAAKPTKQFLYMVTDYIEGQSLREWMGNHPNPDLSEVKAIILQIIAAIRSLHRMDMVHRDLKPDNVMIDRSGMVKLIDLGSVQVASLDEQQNTADNQLLGSVDYTAPEYLLYGRADRASDLYSLGVILYEMLTHKLPYGRGFKNSYDVKRLKYISALSINDNLPEWIEAILQKSVAKDVNDRYERFSELEHELSKPKHEVYTKTQEPLLARNPILFWQSISAILAMIIVTILAVGD